MMSRAGAFALALALGATGIASAKEAKLVRYPHYHDGKVAFSYLGDIWTAGEDGKNIQRLTVHKARDVYPAVLARRQVDRVLLRPEGQPRRLPDPGRGRRGQGADHPLGRREGAGLDARLARTSCSPASGARTSCGKLYTVPVDGGLARDAGPDMGVDGSYSPDGQSWPSTARARPTGASTTAALPERRDRDGPGLQDVQGPDRLRRPGLLADVGRRTATSTSSPTARATA